MERVRRGDLTFDVRDSGPADGEPVVLLHGFPQDGSCWDDVVPLLNDAGLRTLAPDQRGYSPGARPRGRAAYALEECALDVLAVLDAAGLARAHVVGHDWGGAVAWQLAGGHEDRIRSATVLSTPHPGALMRAVPGKQALRSSYVALFQVPVLPELLVPRTLKSALRRSGLPEEAAERYVARLGDSGAIGPALNWYRALPWSARTPSGRSRVPTTYVWGRQDPALGPRAAQLTARYVAAPYRFVPLDAGHWLPETRPREVAELILERTAATVA